MTDAPALPTYAVEDGVAVLTLDDGKVNVISHAVLDAVDDALDRAEGDGARALVIAGRTGGAFSAGFDLPTMTESTESMRGLVMRGARTFMNLYGFRLPTVAACTGHALAAGALVLLGCDLRIGADVDCKIGLNEVAIAMVLPDWAFTIAVDRLSKRHLQRAVATARLTDAAGAVDVGYLDEVVAADDLLDVAVARAAEFATLDQRAYAGTIRRLRGEVLDLMAYQIDADREAGQVPNV